LTSFFPYESIDKKNKEEVQKRGKTMSDEKSKEVLAGRALKPLSMNLPVQVWSCTALKEMISKEVRAHVKDVELASRLEHMLGDQVAYGDGGGGNIGAA
jgi:hypothetical protein